MSVSPEEKHRRDDEACIFMLEATSCSGDPREFLRSCRYCGNPFWVRVRGAPGGVSRIYCQPSHCVLHFYYAHRAMVLARQKHYRVRRRAARAAA